MRSLRPDAAGLVAGAPDAPVDAADRATTIAVGTCVLAVLLLFVAASGGFAVTVWLPAALFLVALLAVVAFVRPELIGFASLPVGTAIGALALFAAWSFLSITWADVQADAWDGANRSLLYLTVFTLVALCPWTPRTAVVFLAVFSLWVAALGAMDLVRAARTEDPSGFFIAGRLNAPIGYHNADAALFMLAFWPAFILASRRWVGIAARGLLFAAAGVLLELAVLPQSRGSAIALAFAAAAFVAIVPNRVRTTLVAFPVIVAFALSLPTLLDVREAVRGGDPTAALESAVVVMLVTAAALGAAGALFAFVDRRIDVPRRVTQIAGVALATAVGAALLAGVAVAASTDPAERIERSWRDFKSGLPVEGSTHFTSGLGSNRYDFWRVALGEFRASPLTGIGADNFAVPYVRERQSDEEPSYPHSLAFGTLAQTGLVGAALLVVFFATALTAAAGAWRSQDRVRRGVVAAAVVAAAYWIVHASGDWLWEIPATGAVPMALLGLAASLGGRRSHPPTRRAAPAVRLLASALAAIVFVAAAASLVFPWLAAKQVDAAAARWQRDPRGAYERLDSARRLNPLSARADLIHGAIAARLGDQRRMQAAFLRALEREPHSWYAQLELAVAEWLAGRRDPALARLVRAEVVNPREPAIPIVRARIRRGEPVPPAMVDRLFLRRLEERGL